MKDDDDDALLSPSILPPLTTIASPLQPLDDSSRQLKPTPTKTSRFELPGGWEVQYVPRAIGKHVDKYYFEEGSDRRFRSLKEVERYVRGQENITSKKPYKAHKHISKSGQRKRAVSGRMLLKLDEISDEEQLTIENPSSAAGTSHFALPVGWVVKEVPSKYQGLTTKFYYEPGTGQRFRSFSAVRRYISEKNVEKNIENNIENAPLAKMFELGSGVKKPRSKKKISERKIDGPTLDFSRTPAKINWILDDSVNGKWNALIGQSMVPEPIRQLWEEKFQSSINGNDDGMASAIVGR
ncbi:methyl-CpG-binding domain-containing protein 7-like [Impatiens glandulifera]|uniref:methyl-CpG-binding domain-containing protein 7-like n=1 Tax=Impatiens glandulifera TaxID=253017 RepID=UPI001FB19832|nr:methyl-CpG-binding domain-containing protein 7-like [Impatiens glandulifera]